MEAERERLAECTFAPRINTTKGSAAPRCDLARPDAPTTPRQAHSSSRGGFGPQEEMHKKVPAGERLHVDADRRAEMKERSRVASERWELAHHR